MPRLQTRRHFLCQSAALAAGAYGTRAFSKDGRPTHAVAPVDSIGGHAAVDMTVATVIGAGQLGTLREVICWTQVRSHESNFISGQQAFRRRGCQLLAEPYLALGLGHPATVYAAASTTTGAEFPDAMAVRYEFPEHGAGLVLTWYDGEWAPPYESIDGFPLAIQGTLYLGQDGQLLEDGITGQRMLLRDGQLPRELPTAVLRREQSPERPRFVDSAVVAGIVSYQVRQSLDWDGAAMRARNCPQATPLIRECVVAGRTV